MTRTACNGSCDCKKHCNDHVSKFMQDMASRVADGKNFCAKVGTGHWNRRVATCDLEGGVVVIREGGSGGRQIWRAIMGQIQHTEFRGGVHRFVAPGVEPLFLFEP